MIEYNLRVGGNHEENRPLLFGVLLGVVLLGKAIPRQASGQQEFPLKNW